MVLDGTFYHVSQGSQEIRVSRMHYHQGGQNWAIKVVSIATVPEK